MAGDVLDVLRRARHQAEVLHNIVRAGELVAEASAAADVEERYHVRRFLDWLGHALPPSAAPTVGEAWAALVDVDGSGEPFLARVVVEQRGPLLPPGCGAAFAGAVERAVHAVLDHLLTHHRFQPRRMLEGARCLALRGPPAAAWVADGGSIAAAVAVAVFSRWTQLAVPADLAFSGEIDAQGRVQPVARVEEKVRRALRERPTLRGVVVPAAGAPVGDRVLGVSTVAELLAAAFGDAASESCPPSLVEVASTVRLGVELYEKENNFAAALCVLRSALAAIDERRRAAGDGSLHRGDEFIALWRGGSCLIQLGDMDDAAALLARAQRLGEELWAAGELSPQAFIGLRGNLAVLLRDAFRVAEAEELLRENLRLQRLLRQDKREVARTLGNLGELLTLVGRVAEAEELLREALEALRAVYPDEVPRELCYLGQLELRRGDARAARAFFTEGLRLNEAVEHGAPSNEGFLRLGLVRACVALGCVGEALREADVALERLPASQLYPRGLIVKQRGLALLVGGDRAAGRADLERAGDLCQARGGLLRFVLGTALGELALELTSHAPIDEARARDCARRFAATLAEVPGLDVGRELAARIRELASADPLPVSLLHEALRRALGCCPY